MQAVLESYAKFNAPRLESLSPEMGRNLPTLKTAAEDLIAECVGARAIAFAKPACPRVGLISHEILPGPGGDILVRIYTPRGDGPFPVLVYFHGGGWVISNLDVYDSSCRALCRQTKCAVVSVAYRRAPEHPYPAAIEDAYAATRWAMINARQFNGDPARVAVGGENAGGNLAAVVCLMARDNGEPLPVAQLLIYPVTDTSMSTDSYREHADALPLNSAMMAWYFKHYLADPESASQPYAAPLRAQDLTGLPPAIVITAEIDPLRDEGEAYANRLSQAGVWVSAHRYLGVTHEFFGLAAAVREAKDAVQQAADCLQKAFAVGGNLHAQEPKLLASGAR
jgi:acetyl esterase